MVLSPHSGGAGKSEVVFKVNFSSFQDAWTATGTATSWSVAASTGGTPACHSSTSCSIGDSLPRTPVKSLCKGCSK
jgi:hypothetical protein